MIDFEALLLDPVYAATGTPSTLTDKAGVAHPVTLLDRRDGADTTTARGGSINILLPGVTAVQALAYVRHSECPEQPVGWTLRFEDEDQAYSVRSAKLKGRPGRGEWVCELQKA